MKIPKRHIVFFLFAVTIQAGTFALTVENVLPPDIARQLKQNGAVSRESFDNSKLNLAPNYDTLTQLVAANRKGLIPNFTMETLHLYKKSSAGATPTILAWTAAEQLALFNNITALSTIKGVEYYSKSRDRMRILYENAFIIDGPNSKKPLPDPVYRSLPAQTELYTRLKDSTFGDNVYKFTFYTNETSFIVFQENMTSISYALLPLVGKNNLQSVIAVMDCGQYLLIYASTYAKASILPGMKQRVAESIGNKFAATLGWFIKKADKTFNAAGQ